jgi:hypothetical protein
MLNDALNCVYISLKEVGRGTVGRREGVVFMLLSMWLFCVLCITSKVGLPWSVLNSFICVCFLLARNM